MRRAVVTFSRFNALFCYAAFTVMVYGAVIMLERAEYYRATVLVLCAMLELFAARVAWRHYIAHRAPLQ